METAASDVEAIRTHGYVVLPELLGADELTTMRAALAARLERRALGRNDFEGFETERVYSLVGVDPCFERLVEHPRIVAVCDAFLQPNYLLTASQAIRIHPGETPQPFHTDDPFYSIPRPRAAVSVSTIWAVDAFTSDNGATQILPGSHLWGDEQVGELLRKIDFRTASPDERAPRPASPLPETWASQLLDVTMPPGSVVVFLGTLVHRGGENRSQAPRLALSNQYCQPWARQQECYLLSVPRERARNMSARVQSMLGYSVHPPFMGHVGGRHPLRLLDEEQREPGDRGRI